MKGKQYLPDDCCLCDLVMAGEGALHLSSAHSVPTDVNDVINTPRDPIVTVFVTAAPITYKVQGITSLALDKSIIPSQAQPNFHSASSSIRQRAPPNTLQHLQHCLHNPTLKLTPISYPCSVSAAANLCLL